MKKYLLLSLILFTTIGCTTKDDFLLFNQTQATQSNSQEKLITQLKNVQFEYKIQTHDRISIMIYKHPNLSTEAVGNARTGRGLLVNSRGEVRVPLIKRIRLAGLTQTQAEQSLETAYSKYIKEPDIQLEVLNKRAYIIGEVANPGEIELVNERLSLLQMIASAGDLTDGANRKSILILRGGNRSQVTSQVVNLTDIHSLKTANLMIRPNDIVYVTPNDMRIFNTGVAEINPIFDLIGNLLTPFVTLRVLD